MDSYKVNILMKILESMKQNKHYLCRLKGDNTKYINIDEEAIKLLIKYYSNKAEDLSMKNKIKTLMEDLLQRNCICNYTLVQNCKETYLKNINALDAYMMAYDMSKDGDIKCYMTPNGKRAYGAIFTVINNVVTLSGVVVV